MPGYPTIWRGTLAKAARFRRVDSNDDSGGVVDSGDEGIMQAHT